MGKRGPYWPKALEHFVSTHVLVAENPVHIYTLARTRTQARNCAHARAHTHTHTHTHTNISWQWD